MATDNVFRRAIAEAHFSFTARPEPIPGDLRLSWGIGVLLLILFYCVGKKSSFQRLQFLAHAIRTLDGRDEVRGLFSGQVRPTDVSVRVEPWLNRAVSYAHGLELVSVTRGKSVALTQRGQEIAGALNACAEIFVEERKFLVDVARRLTEARIKAIWRLEDLL